MSFDPRVKEVEAALHAGGERQLSYAQRNHFAIKEHLKQVLQSPKYTGLRSQVTVYYFGGRRMNVLQLMGVIPVTISRQPYNIPVQIVIPEDYPQQPPHCYVKPTADMQLSPVCDAINPSTGQVTLPSLRSWTTPRSTILSIVDDLCDEFSRQTPVYAAPSSAPGPSAMQHHMSHNEPSQPHRPPGSSGNPFPPSNPYPSPSTSGRPMYPSVRPVSPPGGYPVYPPPASASSQSSSMYYPTTPTYNNPASMTRTSGGGSPYPAQAPTPSHGHGPPPPGYGGTPPLQPQAPPGPAPSADWKLNFQQTAVTGLLRRFKDGIEASSAEMDARTEQLRDTEKDLTTKSTALKAASDAKARELRDLESNVAALSLATQNMKSWIDENEDKVAHLDGAVGADEAIQITDDFAKQAMEAQAEDTAIEDCLELLHDALKVSSISLSSYAKQVRELATEQFKSRALGTKVQAAQRAKHHQQQQQQQQQSQSNAQAPAPVGVMLPQGDGWAHQATMPSGPYMQVNPARN